MVLADMSVPCDQNEIVLFFKQSRKPFICHKKLHIYLLQKLCTCPKPPHLPKHPRWNISAKLRDTPINIYKEIFQSFSFLKNLDSFVLLEFNETMLYFCLNSTRPCCTFEREIHRVTQTSSLTLSSTLLTTKINIGPMGDSEVK